MGEAVLSRPLALVLDPADNVAVAVADLAAGTDVALDGVGVVTAVEPIRFGHKLATVAIAAGAPIRKYDEVIGRASADIAAGAHVHVHNVVSARLPGPSARAGR
jgi:altronate dehydratase